MDVLDQFLPQENEEPRVVREGLDFGSRAALRQAVTLSPEERAVDEARDLTPENLEALDRQIYAYRNSPARRQPLEEERTRLLAQVGSQPLAPERTPDVLDRFLPAGYSVERAAPPQQQPQQQPQPQREQSYPERVLRALPGSLEASARMALGFPGYVASGLVAAATLPFVGPEKAAQAQQNIAAALNPDAFVPPSETAQQAGEMIGALNEKAGEVGRQIGRAVTGGSEAGGLAGEIAAQTALQMMPIPGVRAVHELLNGKPEALPRPAPEVRPSEAEGAAAVQQSTTLDEAIQHANTAVAAGDPMMDREAGYAAMEAARQAQIDDLQAQIDQANSDFAAQEAAGAALERARRLQPATPAGGGLIARALANARAIGESQADYQARLARQEAANASAVRGDQGQLPEGGETAQGGGAAGGNDLQLAPTTGLDTNGAELRGAGEAGVDQPVDEVIPAATPQEREDAFQRAADQQELARRLQTEQAYADRNAELARLSGRGLDQLQALGRDTRQDEALRDQLARAQLGGATLPDVRSQFEIARSPELRPPEAIQATQPGAPATQVLSTLGQRIMARDDTLTQPQLEFAARAGTPELRARAQEMLNEFPVGVEQETPHIDTGIELGNTQSPLVVQRSAVPETMPRRNTNVRGAGPNELSALSYAVQDVLDAAPWLRQAATKIKFFGVREALPYTDVTGKGQLATFWPNHDAITVRSDVLADTSTVGRQRLAAFLTHEFAHVLDRVQGLHDTYLSDVAPDMRVIGTNLNRRPVGSIVREAHRAFLRDVSSPEISSYLNYPLRHWQDSGWSNRDIQRELFAQFARLYVSNPTLLRQELPNAHALFERIGREGWTPDTARSHAAVPTVSGEVPAERAGMGGLRPELEPAAGVQYGEAGNRIEHPAAGAEVRPEGGLGVSEFPERDRIKAQSYGLKILGGRIVGAPEEIKTVRDVEDQGALLARRAESHTGHPRDWQWYKDAAQTIREYGGGSRRRLEFLTRITARSSQRAQVEQNARTAVETAIAYEAGDPGIRNTMMTPQKWRAQIEKLLAAGEVESRAYNKQTGIEGVGPKILNFYRNLHDEVFNENRWPEAVTIDRHAARTIGLPESMAPSQYDYGAAVYRLATKIYNRKTGQNRLPREMQARLWGWQLNRPGVEAAKREHRSFAPQPAENFGPTLRSMGHLVTAEAVPSQTFPEGRAISTLPRDTQVEFTRKAFDLVGGLSGQLGITFAAKRPASGGYEGRTTPNYVLDVLGSQFAGHEPLDHTQATQMARALQYVFKQDSVPWFAPREEAARRFDTGQVLVDDGATMGYRFRFANLDDAKEADFFAALRDAIGELAGYTRDGDDIFVSNFTDIPNQQFVAALDRMGDNLLERLPHERGLYGAESHYEKTDWKIDGENVLNSLLDSVNPERRPVLEAWLRDRRSLFDELAREYAAKADPRAGPDTTSAAEGETLAPKQATPREGLGVSGDNDAARQERWLEEQAKQEGFQTLDQFATERPERFEELAERWRREHPENLASRSGTFVEQYRHAEDSAQRIFGNYAEAKRSYEAIPETRGGRVLNPDIASALVPEYVANRELASAVHDQASDFVKRYFAERLSRPTPPGVEPGVAFTAGGPGSGKSASIAKALGDVLQRFEMVYDSSLSRLGSAVARIDQALAAGRSVQIYFVQREPAAAYEHGVVDRAERGERRLVPLAEHTRSHVESRAVLPQLAKRYANDDRVNITAINNNRNLGAAFEMNLEDIDQKDYHATYESVRQAAERARAQGRLTQEQLERAQALGAAGRRAEALGEMGRAANDRQPQPSRGQQQEVTPPPGSATLRGMDVGRVWSSLQNRFGEKGIAALQRAGILKVAQRFQDLPEHTREGMQAGDEAIYARGTAYLIADNLSEARLVPVLLHEIGEHYGMERVFGKATYEGLLDRVRELYASGDDRVATAWQEVRDAYTGPDSSIHEGDRTFTREVLAKLGESAAFRSHPLWQRALYLFRRFLRSIGLDVKLSPTELSEAVAASFRSTLREATGQRPVAPRPQEAMASRPPRAQQQPWVEKMSAPVQEALRKAGVWAPKQSLAERWKETKHELGLKVLQGTLDQFAPVLRKIGDYPYKLLRMAASADAGLEAALEYGRPRLNDAGALDVDRNSPGFLKVMKPLQGEADRFLAWIAGNRAERLSAEDREHLFGGADIDALKSLNRKMHADDNFADGTDGSKRPEVYAKVLGEYNAFSRSILDIAEKAGIINAAGRAVWEREFYVPFFREADEGKVTGPGNLSGMVNQYAFKKLKGGAGVLHDLLANTMQNWSHLLQASLRNQAARVTLEEGAKLGIAHEVKTDEKGSVYILKNGEKVHYVVDDPLVLDAISSLGTTPFRGPAMQALSKMKHLLTVGTTMSPVFRLRHTLREQITALAANPTTYNFVKNWIDGFRYSSRDNPQYGPMLAGGSFFRMGMDLQDQSAAYVKRLLEHGIDAATVLDSPSKVESALKGAWDWWKETGERSDSITRANIYRQTYAKMIEQGKSPDLAHFEAAYAARDVMDYGLRGTWPAIRMSTQVVPFMNARMQGLYKLGRGAAADPRRFSAVIGGITLASIALYLAYKDDEDFQRRSEWDRNNNWWFKIGDKALRVPKPFEVGAIATVAERALETALNGFDPESRERFARQILLIAGSQLNLNPIPQAVWPALQLWANKDVFLGMPIESERDQNVSTAQRIGPHTSATAQLLGKAGVLSPEQIDFLANAYFGWVGSHVIATSDLALRPIMDLPVQPTPRVDDYFLLGDFVKQMPSNQSRFVAQFYDHLKKTQEAFGDLRTYQQTGQREALTEALANPEVQVAGIYRTAMTRLSKINNLIRATQAESIDPDTKRAKLDSLYQMKNEIAQAVEARRNARLQQ